MRAEYFSTESTVMFPAIEMKMFSATLAFISLLIGFPLLSGA